MEKGWRRGYYLFKDAVMSYLDVRRCVRDCLKHPALVRRGQEGPKTNLSGRNLVTQEWSKGEAAGWWGGGEETLTQRRRLTPLVL
jgi:hypothetical protein